MDVRPGYKQTEVGIIPEDWGVRPFQSLAHIERGKFTARPRNDPKYYGGEIPFIQTGDVTNSRGWIRTYSQTLNPEGLKVSKLFPRGTLFLTIAANIGDVGLASFATACPDSLVSITPVRGIDKHWLAHELGKRKPLFENLASHNAQLNISLEKLKPYLLPVPTLAEQEAIAEALSDADALIESLEQLLAKKRQIKKGAMQELLTGAKRLPGFRGEWELRTFGDLFEYHPTATNSRSDFVPEGDTFCVHYGDIHTRFHNHLDFGVVKPPRIDRSRCSNAALLKNGDWVMADASEDHEGVGKAVEIQGLHTDITAVAGLHTLLLREKKPTFSLGFKGHLGNLRSLHQQLRRVATGMKVFGVSKAALKGIEIPVPPPQEQGSIAAILSDMDAEITALEAKLSKARQIKQGMMQELLTGRIRLV